MLIRRWVSFVGVAAIAAFASAWLRAASLSPMPDVTLQNADGKPVPLADYKGKVLLVDFWASWCTSCKTSFPAIDALSEEYGPRGFDVLAVNLDERRRDADAFLGDRPHHVTILFDPKGASPVAFGVKGMPTSFLIDRTGHIRFTHVGYSGNVAETYRREVAALLAEH